MSSRPKPKPKVWKPIDSSATLPAKTSRSAQEIFWPYFCLTGHSSRRALSRLALSGQLLSGAKRCAPCAAAAAAVVDAVGAGGVPAHPDEQAAVVAVVGRPPVLRRRHQLGEVALERLDVEALRTASRVVEVRAQRVGPRASAGAAPAGRAGWATSPGSSAGRCAAGSGTGSPGSRSRSRVLRSRLVLLADLGHVGRSRSSGCSDGSRRTSGQRPQ